MPSIDELKEKKRFKKKAYRPWNLLDEATASEAQSRDPLKEASQAAPTSLVQAEAQQKESEKVFTSGNCPDHIATGEIELIVDQTSDSAQDEKKDSNSTAKGQQLDSNQAEKRGFDLNPKGQQFDSRGTAEGQQGNSLDSNWTPNRTAGRQQFDSIRTAEGQPLDSKNWSVDSLSGKEADLIQMLFNRCKNAGSRQTEKLSSHILSEALKVSTRRLRNLVERLAAKNLLIVSSSKRGNGSWRQFTLPNGVYQDMALNHIDSNSTAERQQLNSNKTADWTATKTAEPSSSSSSLRSIDLETTTTGEATSAEPRELDALWQSIDCSPLVEFRLGRSQIAQIAQSGRVTPEELQESIYAFAFDLCENQKTKNISGAPLNYFMGILRKGPYTPPANYEAPEIQQRRLYIEAKEQQRKKRLELEERLEALEFEEWLEKLSLEQRAVLVPPKDFAKPGGTAHNYQLREYFRENVWPQLRERTAKEGGDSHA